MIAIQNNDGSFSVEGITHSSVNALERAYGLPKNALRNRLRLGWDLSRALTQPVDRDRSLRARKPVRSAGAQRSNAASAMAIPENATSQAIRAHLAGRDDPAVDRRQWWLGLGSLYAVLRDQAFSTPSGATRPGFYEWLRSRGLMPFGDGTAKAAIRIARNADAVRRSQAWLSGKTSPTDLARGLPAR